jgi:hypothetical protein
MRVVVTDAQTCDDAASTVTLGSGDNGGEAFITDRVKVGVVLAFALQMIFCPLIALLA